MNKYLFLQLFSCYSVAAFVLPRNFRQQSRVVVNGMWPFGKSNVPSSSSSSSSPWSSIEFQQALERQPVDAGNLRWEELDRLLRSQESPEERARSEDILSGHTLCHRINTSSLRCSRGDQKTMQSHTISLLMSSLSITNHLITPLSSMPGRGDASHKANVRFFGAPEGFQPEVTLYRDTAGWCPYCENVNLTPLSLSSIYLFLTITLSITIMFVCTVLVLVFVLCMRAGVAAVGGEANPL